MGLSCRSPRGREGKGVLLTGGGARAWGALARGPLVPTGSRAAVSRSAKSLRLK